jgi:hypothetical protein
MLRSCSFFPGATALAIAFTTSIACIACVGDDPGGASPGTDAGPDVSTDAGGSTDAGSTDAPAAETSTPGDGAVPFTLTDIDIGSPGLAGSESVSAVEYTLNGGGAQIGNPFDQFNFAYQQVTGDCTIIARLTGLTPTSAYAQAGLMIRNDLTSESASAMMHLIQSGGAFFANRPVANVPATAVQGPSPQLFVADRPWFKLTRRGNTLTGYAHADGPSTWIQIGDPVSVTMNATSYIGLAVSAHDNTKVAMGTFDNLTITTP